MQRLICILFLFVLPITNYAAQLTYLKRIYIKPSLTNSRFIFVLSKKTNGRVKYIPQLNQLTVDFANTYKKINIQNVKIANANVESITLKTFPKAQLRFIVYVKQRIKWKIHYIDDLPLQQQNTYNKDINLQLDIYSPGQSNTPLKNSTTSTEKFNRVAQLKTLFQNDIQQKLSRVFVKAKKPAVFTIIVDAGHGGKDYGALGVRGTAEKNVVLKIAQKLAAKLRELPNVKVILTRNGDYFLPLVTRLKLARKGKADLFIAIHADAHYSKSAKGASVYALSQHGATSIAARWLAMRDNYSELGGVAFDALQDQSTVLRSVLIDLAQTATIQDSINLGNKILFSLHNIARLHYPQVERAPFLVLKSPDIPSVLVETGFISNPQEEQRLVSGQYQDKIASALCLGIMQYMHSSAAR